MSLVSSFFGTRCISHTRTVVRECGKDDDQCQWERLKFDPPPPLNPLPIVTKIYLRDYVADIYHPAKFHPNRIKGFLFCACAISRVKLFTRLFFRFFWGGGSSNRLQPRRPHGFWRKIRQKTRFCARMCLLGVAKPKVKFLTPYCPKTRICETFRSKTP